MAIQAQVTLKGVKLYWPFLTKKNEMAGKYTVDVANLTKDHIAALKEIGLGERVRTKKDEREQFVTCKSNFPPKVMLNKTRSEIDASNVGNETVANMTVTAYDGHYPGLFAGIGSIVITDLKEYNSGGGVDDDLFEGEPEEDNMDDDLDGLFTDD